MNECAACGVLLSDLSVQMAIVDDDDEITIKFFCSREHAEIWKHLLYPFNTELEDY